MILTTSAVVQFNDRRAIWNSLRRFQNVAFVARQIMQLQSVPPDQKSNVRKQAEQIRYCLFQAAEYFVAAQSVSLATKPLLLYYGIMSLALAEILFKQDGGSSLDKARGQNAHHGLTLRVDGKPSKLQELSDSANALRAEPLIREDGARFGTFELWHQSSRETPVSGKFERFFANGTKNEGVAVIAAGADARLPELPNAGVSLLDCFKSLPALVSALVEHDVQTELVRARIKRHMAVDNNSTDTLIIQPTPAPLLQDLLPLLRFRSFAMEQLEIVEMVGGYGVSWKHGPGNPGPDFNFPNSMQAESEFVYFCTRNSSLNEFGLLYSGMYILGNYARYFPEQWMADVESASELATASEAFIACAESRAPVLVLSELSRRFYLDS